MHPQNQQQASATQAQQTHHEFTAISIDGLLRHLNNLIPEGEEEIELGKPRELKLTEMLKSRYWRTDREILTSLYFPLMRTAYDGMLSALGIETERQVGHVILEAGHIDLTDHDPGVYESLKLRLDRIKFENGLYLPPSTVKIFVGLCWGFSISRVDHKKIGPLWIRYDGTDTLPTSMFLTEDAKNYISCPIQRK